MKDFMILFLWDLKCCDSVPGRAGFDFNASTETGMGSFSWLISAAERFCTCEIRSHDEIDTLEHHYPLQKL